ncbi:hypothetical protein DERF_010327 [Dermatophagoides farinae]|uniref:Uncharacterized protein n=1 Tax=Dermatophagoides farinae TaxID=6954 RepID=A0A922HYQ9_DERFA|nr:hypothetical protein DERF_010327 [Dermatophagoides farinae]
MPSDSLVEHFYPTGKAFQILLQSSIDDFPIDVDLLIIFPVLINIDRFFVVFNNVELFRYSCIGVVGVDDDGDDDDEKSKRI